jgi:cytoskeletal protein CcmA (bactofilin family)
MQSRNIQPDGGQRIAPAGGESEYREAAKGQQSVIGADIVITGNIEASVDLHIEGKVTGDVRCTTLILGESSSVNGHIYAARVKVSGSVDGAIDTKDLAIEASARLTAEITYERLRVANGGAIEGTMRRRIPEENADDANKLKLVEPPAPPVQTAPKIVYED